MADSAIPGPHYWMDPGDGTLIPVELIGRSVWPGAWKVRDGAGMAHHTSRVVDSSGEPLRRTSAHGAVR